MKTPLNDQHFVSALNPPKNEILPYLMEKGVPINIRAKSRRNTPVLIVACTSENLDICKLLLEKGANPEARNHHGRTPLFIAASRSNEPLFRLFVDHGAKINIRTTDHQGNSLYHIVAKSGSSGIFNCLVESGIKPDVKIKDKDGKTLLHNAAESGNGEICRYLLNVGADRDAKSNLGEMPIHFAAQAKYSAACQVFVDAGADLESCDKTYKHNGKTGFTPLEYAIYSRSVDSLGVLIDAGVRLDYVMKSNEIYTPLRIALMGNKLELCKRLVSEGAKVEPSMLHLAAMFGHIDICVWLLENNIDIDNKSGGGRTPLLAAAFENNIEGCRFLLERGANVRVCDDNGRGVIELVKMWYHDHDKTELLQLFQSYLDRPNGSSQNNDGVE